MTWKVEIVEQIRVLIGDMDDASYTYTDARLARVSVASAIMVMQEVDFSTIYTVDISEQTILPDPTSLGPKDTNFINLVSLKAAIMVYTGELRKYALAGAFIIDGPSQINMVGVYTNMKGALTNLQTQYEKAKVLYQTGQNGQAVMTPYTTTNVYPIQDF